VIQIFPVAHAGVAPRNAAAADPVAVAGQHVSRSGWVHIIWNGEPRFMLVDDHGASIRLLIDEGLIRSFGGPQGIDRKRVIIVGERVSETPDVVRVFSIEMLTN
jgi:hypothetical protein